MDDKNPVEQMINEIGDLLNLFFDKTKMGLKEGVNVEEEVYPTLINAAINVRAMKDALADAMEEEGISERDLQKLIDNPPDTMTPKDKQVLEKATKMRKEIDVLYRILKKNEEEQPKKKKKEDVIFKKGDKKSKKAQKNLQIGMRKGWKKL